MGILRSPRAPHQPPQLPAVATNEEASTEAAAATTAAAAGEFRAADSADRRGGARSSNRREPLPPSAAILEEYRDEIPPQLRASSATYRPRRRVASATNEARRPAPGRSFRKLEEELGETRLRLQASRIENATTRAQLFAAQNRIALTLVLIIPREALSTRSSRRHVASSRARLPSHRTMNHELRFNMASSP